MTERTFNVGDLIGARYKKGYNIYKIESIPTDPTVVAVGSSFNERPLHMGKRLVCKLIMNSKFQKSRSSRRRIIPIEWTVADYVLPLEELVALKAMELNVLSELQTKHRLCQQT